MTEIIKIAGRQFKGAKDSTMEHDVVTQGLIAKADLDRIVMLPGESSEEFALRIFRKAAVNSDVFLLLGCLLFPVDLNPGDWTPQIGEETALFLRKLTGEDDKRIVQGQIIAAIMAFFQRGLAYSVFSQKSSAKDQPDIENQTVDLMSSENGATSSEQSPTTM